MGRICDRLGGRRVLVGTFVVGGAALVSLGLAPTCTLLLLTMAVGGLAAASANPATNRLVLAAVPAGARGLAVGFKQSGVQLAAFLSGAALPSAAVAIGWRATLVISGTVVALGVPLVLLPVPRTADRGRGRHRTAARPRRRPAGAERDDGGSRVGDDRRRRDRDPARLGRRGRPPAVADVGTADPRRRAAVSVALLAAVPAVGPWALWAGAGVLGTTALGWNGVAMLVAMNAVDEEHSGWATGRVILAFYPSSC